MYSRIEYRIVLLWVQRMYALHIVPQWSRTLLWICVCGEIIGILCGYGSLSAQSADELLSQQSFVRQIRLDQAWRTLDALPPPAQPMTIAVIAGGFDLTHPDLQGAWFVNPNDPINGRDDDNNGFIDDNQGWDFIGNAAGALVGQGYVEEDNVVQSRHGATARTGTHVAGIIAALRNNGIGIAGIARNVRILPLKIGNDDSTQQASGRIADAIRYAVMMGAKIIVLTTSVTAEPFSAYRPSEQEAINTAMRQGVLVFAPAGLTASSSSSSLLDETTFPAGYDNVITVGASAEDNTRMSNARLGNRVMIYAPGESIVSTLPNGRYGAITGSEQAVAVAAGVAALIWQVHPTWSAWQVALQLESTSDNTLLPTQSERTALAYGQVHALRAVTANRAGGASIPALGISDGIAYSLADNVLGNPLQVIANTAIARLTVRVKNYQADRNNVTVQLVSVGDSALIIPVDASVIRTIPSLGAQQTRNVEFLVQLTPRAFQSGLVQGDVVVVIRSGEYVQYVPLRLPIRTALDGVRGLMVSSRIELGSNRGTDNISRVVQWLNPSTTTQTITGITLGGAQAGEFSLAQLPTFPVQIQPGSTQTCTVIFRTTSATTTGVRQANLLIRSTDSLYTAVVSANRTAQPLIAVNQGAFRVSSTMVNGTTRSTLTLSLPGFRATVTTAVISIDTLATESGEYAFAAGFSPLLTIPPSGTTASIPVIFSPRVAGQRTIALRLQSTGIGEIRLPVSGLAVQPDANGIVVVRGAGDRQLRADDLIEWASLGGSSFGASSQTETLTIRNVSAGTVTLTGMVFSGAGAGDCSTTQVFPVSLSGGQEMNISIRVTPSRAGETFVRVALAYTTASSTRTENISAGIIALQAPTSRFFTTQARTREDISVSGYGVMYPVLTPVFISQNSAYQTFFQAREGVAANDTIIIRNPTASQASISAMSFSDPSYRVVSSLPRTLAPNATDVIAVQYVPTSTTFASVQVQAELRIGTASIRDTAWIQPAVVPTTYIVANGSGNQPNLMALFATTTIGDTSFALTAPNISNNGRSSVQVNVFIAGLHADEFQVMGFAQSRTGTLSAGASDSLVLRFLPQRAGIKTAVITLQAGASIMRYQVVARAIERPSLTLEVGAVNLGAIGDGEELIRSVSLTGRNLTSSIIVNVTGHQALFTMLNDSVRFLRSYQVQPNDDGTFADSLRILAAPQFQPDTLVGAIQVVSGTALAQVIMSATSRPTLLPRLRTIDQITYDTVVARGVATRSIPVSGVNLTQDITITLPDNVSIEANGYQLTRSGRIPRASFDSSWVMRWTPPQLTLQQLRSLNENSTVIPYRDTLRVSSGSVRLNIPIVGAIAPLPELVVEQSVTLNAITQGEQITTTITISAVQVATGGTITLQMSPDETDSVRVMKFITQNALRQIQRTDSLMITLPSGVTFFTTTITVQYAPTIAEQKTGVIVMQAPSVRGDTLNASVVVLGTAQPRPGMLATTQGIEFGTVQIFSNTPRISQLAMRSVRDTVRWRILGGDASPFSVEIANERYRKTGVFIPNDINQVDTSIVVWFEPLEAQRYLDTLRFISADFGIYDIILGGTSSTVTSIGLVQGRQGAVRIVPSIVDDEMYIKTEENLPGSTKIEFFNILGQSVMTYRMENLTAGQYRIPILNQQVPHGLLLWRITKSENTVFSGRVIIR